MKVVNGVLLFPARDANHGIELWTSDGTSAGTHLFLDVNPGPSSANPGGMLIFNNHMLFTADDGTNGRELWTTDGTVAGTHMVKDIEPGSASSSPFSLITFGNAVYFSASSGLWKTDGTEAGTVKVADVLAQGFRVAGSKLFLQGYTAATGLELWVSDGTSGGTHMVTEILPGTAGAFDSNYSALGITVLGNGVIFPANDGVHGRELWYSDGTAAGTHIIRDFLPGPKGLWDAAYAYVTAFNGRAFFTASDAEHGQELWVTDGTDAGTSLFADLVPGTGSSGPIALVVSGSKLYFAASDSPGFTYRLWVSDGTPAGTRVLNGATLSNSFAFGPVNGKLYFNASTNLTGTEPWVTDGTDAGTHMIANLSPDDPPSGNPGGFVAAGQLLFFFANEGLSPSGSTAASFWRTDGTIQGTIRLGSFNSRGDPILPAGPIVFFTSWNSDFTKSTLMQSDGTVDGTIPAAGFLDRFGGNKPTAYYTFGDDIYAVVYNDPTFQFDTSLWRTSAASGGTATKLGTINPFHLTDFGGRKLFFAEFGYSFYRYGLWTTDGTPAGTFAILPDLGDTDPGESDLVNVAGTAFFIQQIHGETSKLWKSDGTADGTVPVKTFPYNVGQAIFKAAGRRLFIYDGGHLWASDGTEAGTIELMKVSFSAQTEPMTVIGNRLVFISYTFEQPLQLWSSDGTVDGTKRIGTVTPTSSSFANIDGKVYFTATDAEHGSELWTTDGTEEGTKMLFDLNPGPAGSNPYGLARAGNSLCFGATTPSTGYELWALPLTDSVLSISDARAAEGDSGNASIARFTVSLSQPAGQTVTVSYATSDGTATAGADYDAASGTLTFAPGETSKTIDVHLRGDVLPENNETFFVTLTNAHGAAIVDGDGAGIIDDDDQMADLEVVPSLNGETFGLYTGVTLTNKGPRSATDIVVNINSAPGIIGDTRCTTCTVPQLASGVSLPAGGSSVYSFAAQTFVAATATARQRDPQSSNNTATWTFTGEMAMNAAWLNPGQTSTITAIVYNPQNTAITNSNPGVAVCPPAVTNVSKGIATFQVTAIATGTSTIGITGQSHPLQINVVAPGTQPRMPNGLGFGTDRSALNFDRPLNVTIQPNGKAPLSGATAAGIVSVMAGNQELAHQTYSGTAKVTFPVYLRALGQNNYSIIFSGDANFLPETVNDSVYVYQGTAVLTGSLDAVPGAAPGTFALTVRASGSPAAAPGGTLSVYDGATKLATIPLVASADGVSLAQTTLANLATAPTLTVNYSGDVYYTAGSQQFRAATSRHHLVKH
jgi:ELWxxDGT repeat protein